MHRSLRGKLHDGRYLLNVVTHASTFKLSACDLLYFLWLAVRLSRARRDCRFKLAGGNGHTRPAGGRARQSESESGSDTRRPGPRGGFRLWGRATPERASRVTPGPAGSESDEPGSTSSLWFFFTLGGRTIALFGRR